MGMINQEKFVELCLRPDATLWEELFNMTGGHWAYGGVGAVQRPMMVNREAALAAYEQAKEYLLAKGYFAGKLGRPWDLVDPTASLDRSQAWWGFEFETGYVSKEALQEALSYTWDNFDNVAYDSEGEGEYYSEITFGPAERSKFLDGTADAFRFMEFLDKFSGTNDTGETMVGTHLNISSPLLDTPVKVSRAALLINDTLHKLPPIRSELFGRSNLYAGAFSHGNYVECKLFRTTYNLFTFKKYLRVADALTKVAELVGTAELSTQHYVSNFQELVDGTAVTPELAVSTTNLTGSSFVEYISGSEFSYEDDDDDDYGYDYSDDDEEDY